MNPRDIFDYKCSSCKALWEPQYFGWNKRTGARLKTCNYCRQVRLARAEVNRASQAVLAREFREPEERRLWDAAAEMNTYTEVDTDMGATAPPTQPVSYYAETATGNTETSESPRGEPIYVDLPPNTSDVYEEEAYLALNPSSSSAGAASHYCPEPEPEPPADFGSDTD